MYFGDFQAVCVWQGHGIHLGTADHPQILACRALRQGLIQGGHTPGPVCVPVVLTCQDQVEPARQRAKTRGQGVPGLAPHQHGAAQGELTKVRQVLWQVPGQGVVAPDDAVVGAGVNQVQRHGDAQPATGALMASWQR